MLKASKSARVLEEVGGSFLIKYLMPRVNYQFKPMPPRPERASRIKNFSDDTLFTLYNNRVMPDISDGIPYIIDFLATL